MPWRLRSNAELSSSAPYALLRTSALSRASPSAVRLSSYEVTNQVAGSPSPPETRLTGQCSRIHA